MINLRYVLVLLSAGFILPQVGNAFWYGDRLSEHLADEGVGLHEYITDNVLGREFNQSLRGVDNNPDELTGVRINKPMKTWGTYTLLNSLGGHADPDDPTGRTLYNAILIDMNGEIVNEWVLNAVPAKLLPGGDIMGGRPERPVGRGLPRLQQLDWCGNEVWFYDPRPDIEVGADYHHDFQREGYPVGYYAPGLKPYTNKGNTLVLSHGYPGVVPEISSFPLLDDKIYEIDWEGNVLFEWNAYEHYEQMGFHEQARDAIMNIQVGRPPTTTTDWQHMNSVSYVGPNPWYKKAKEYKKTHRFKKNHGYKQHDDDEYEDGYKKGRGDLRFHPDNIIFDSRTANYMAIIARYDHPEGKWEAGDIVWRVGPHFSASYNAHKLGQIIGLHMAHLIPMGLPGAGNILVFDNGGVAGFDSFFPGLPGHYPATFRNYSRVIEFNPVTLEVVWEYSDPIQEGDINGDGLVIGDERKFYSNLISGAQRLKNGNTLITEGHGGRVFEITPNKEIVWEYISPYDDGRAPRATDPNAVYRAYRIPHWWIPKNKECL